MQKIHSALELKEAILQLELHQINELNRLKAQFNNAFDSIKPINIIKNTFNEVAESEDLKDKIINTSVGLAAGYVSKTVFEETSHSPFKKLLGTVILFGITNMVAKNPGLIKSLGMGIFNIIKHKWQKRVHDAAY